MLAEQEKAPQAKEGKEERQDALGSVNMALWKEVGRVGQEM